MVKLSQLIQNAESRDGPYIAFEYYPPRTGDGVANLHKRFARMAQQAPLYADMTWGAGGSTSDLTLDLCIKMKEEYGLEPNMHLTCTNMVEEKISIALEGAKSHGIDNIVALRGDPPKGATEWKATEGGFACALDLVKHIRKNYGDFFNISVAGYPEGHPNAIRKVDPDRKLTETEKHRLITLDDGEYVCYDEDYEKELAYLQSKVEAGADIIITQMFFDVKLFLTFVADCRKRGITVPIMPGIMVIQSYGGFKRMTAFCRNRVPLHIVDALEAVKDDDAAVKAAGVRIGVEMSRELIAAGVKGLHFYTLNLEKAVYGILEELGLKKPIHGGEDGLD